MPAGHRHHRLLQRRGHRDRQPGHARIRRRKVEQWAEAAPNRGHEGPAHEGDRGAARELLSELREQHPELTLRWADNAYTGLADWARNVQGVPAPGQNTCRTVRLDVEPYRDHLPVGLGARGCVRDGGPSRQSLRS
jgi:hypothetical protein